MNDLEAELRKLRAQNSEYKARLGEKELELTEMRARNADLEGQLEERKAHRRLADQGPIPNGCYVHGERLTDGDFNRKNVCTAAPASALACCLATPTPSWRPPPPCPAFAGLHAWRRAHPWHVDLHCTIDGHSSGLRDCLLRRALAALHPCDTSPRLWRPETCVCACSPRRRNLCG